MAYQQRIAEYLKAHCVEGIDPRHVEGFMRLQHSTLDRLDAGAFNSEIRLCVECIKEGGVDFAERNAKSFGL